MVQFKERSKTVEQCLLHKELTRYVASKGADQARCAEVGVNAFEYGLVAAVVVMAVFAAISNLGTSFRSAFAKAIGHFAIVGW